MKRPRLLLVPEFTELEWAIKPQLENWAEVASYDPPGVGAELAAKTLDRDAVASRGLEELDCRGWTRYFIAGDGWGIANAVKVALARDRMRWREWRWGTPSSPFAARESGRPSMLRSGPG